MRLSLSLCILLGHPSSKVTLLLGVEDLRDSRKPVVMDKVACACGGPAHCLRRKESCYQGWREALSSPDPGGSRICRLFVRASTTGLPLWGSPFNYQSC